MIAKVRKRQHIVNTPGRRSPAGEAFNTVLGQIVELNRHFTTAAEALTRPAGQTLARWLVLAECKQAPSTVPEIARRLHLARQGVQRIADVLSAEGLFVYEDNPRHRRSKLLALTASGRAVLSGIEVAQHNWCDELGARIGAELLRDVAVLLEGVLSEVAATAKQAAAHATAATIDAD